jgi:hypothetical protein
MSESAQIYKYCSFEIAAKMLLDNTLLLSHFDVYNDPFEAAISWESGKNKSGDYSEDELESQTTDRKAIYADERNKVRVACFSRTNKEILMWSHYADKHAGIAICFSAKKLLDRSYNPEFANVLYGLEKVRVFPKTGPKTLKRKMKESFELKSRSWSYEEEVRMFVPYQSTFANLASDPKLNTVKFDPNAIVSIYYGARSFETNDRKAKCCILHDYISKFNTKRVLENKKAINEYRIIKSELQFGLRAKLLDHTDEHLLQDDEAIHHLSIEEKEKFSKLISRTRYNE